MSKTTLKVETLPIAELITDPDNARYHSARNIESIKQSLSKFGQTKPVVISKEKVVIAGNGTLEAAKQLGWTEIAVSYFSSTNPKTIRAYGIADNRTAELAEWDGPKLLAALEESAAAGLLEATGFSEVEMADLSKVWGEVPDLDDLIADIGEPTDEDGMVRLRILVPPEFAAKWKEAVKAAGSGGELENTCTAIQAAYDAIVNETDY